MMGLNHLLQDISSSVASGISTGSSYLISPNFPPTTLASLSTVIRHFWKRWSTEYLSTLRRYSKWHYSTRNFWIGDVVILQDNNHVPLKWRMGRITGVYPGRDGLIQVVEVKTSSGTYRRPISKIALLLPTAD